MDSLLSSPDRDKMAKQTMEALKKAYNGQVEPLDMAAELWAARQQNLELRRQIDAISQLKERDRLHIAALSSRVGKIKDLSLDQTTLVGQVDVAVWLAREVGLERFLNPEFKRILQNQGLNCQKIDKSFELKNPQAGTLEVTGRLGMRRISCYMKTWTQLWPGGQRKSRCSCSLFYNDSHLFFHSSAEFLAVLVEKRTRRRPPPTGHPAMETGQSLAGDIV